MAQGGTVGEAVTEITENCQSKNPATWLRRAVHARGRPQELVPANAAIIPLSPASGGTGGTPGGRRRAYGRQAKNTSDENSPFDSLRSLPSALLGAGPSVALGINRTILGLI